MSFWVKETHIHTNDMCERKKKSISTNIIDRWSKGFMRFLSNDNKLCYDYEEKAIPRSVQNFRFSHFRLI